MNNIVNTPRLLECDCAWYPSGENVVTIRIYTVFCSAQQRSSEAGLQWFRLTHDVRECDAGAQTRPRLQAFSCVFSTANIVEPHRCSAHWRSFREIPHETETEPTELLRLLLVPLAWCCPCIACYTRMLMKSIKSWPIIDISLTTWSSPLFYR